MEVYPCTSSPALPLISLPACLAHREHIWIPRRCNLLPTPQACGRRCTSTHPSWRSQAPRHSQAAMGLTSSSWQEGGGPVVRGLGKAGGEAGGEAGGGAGGEVGGGETHGSAEIGFSVDNLHTPGLAPGRWASPQLSAKHLQAMHTSITWHPRPWGQCRCAMAHFHIYLSHAGVP